MCATKKGRESSRPFSLYKTKKPWGPEEVPTAFIFIELSDQQRTNPSLVLFRHHQFFPALCIFIRIFTRFQLLWKPLTAFFTGVNDVFYMTFFYLAGLSIKKGTQLNSHMVYWSWYLAK
jgi:hypothetical protein